MRIAISWAGSPLIPTIRPPRFRCSDAPSMGRSAWRRWRSGRSVDGAAILTYRGLLLSSWRAISLRSWRASGSRRCCRWCSRSVTGWCAATPPPHSSPASIPPHLPDHQHRQPPELPPARPRRLEPAWRQRAPGWRMLCESATFTTCRPSRSRDVACSGRTAPFRETSARTARRPHPRAADRRGRSDSRRPPPAPALRTPMRGCRRSAGCG